MSRYRTFSLLLLTVLAGLLLSTASIAQEVPSLEEIGQKYRVVQLSRGWVLQPLEAADFETLEVLDGAVTVDGAEVSESDLRRFVDDDTDWILALASGDSPKSDTSESSELSERDSDSESDSDEPSSDDPNSDEQRVDDSVDDDEAEEYTSDKDSEDADRNRDHRRRNRSDSQVSFGSGMVIEENESVREVVLFSGPLEVKGEVDGDATVIFGSATITGRVDGSLVVVGGSVFLGSNSVIDGDVVAVGGGISREPGSEVDGEITQVGIGEAIDVGDLRIDIGSPHLFWPSFEIFDFSWFDLFGRAIGLGLLAIVLLFTVLLAPNKVHAISARAELEPWKSGLVGLLVEVLFAPLLGLVCIILLISIVGIPLLLFVMPLMCLAIVVYLLLGFAGVSLTTGRWLQKRFDWQNLGLYLLLLVGLLFLYGWSIIGEAMSVTPWPIRLTAILLLMLGFCLKYLAWTIGLGAAVLDQFSPRPSPPMGTRWPEAPTHPEIPPYGAEPSQLGDFDEASYEESAEQEGEEEGRPNDKE